MNKQLLKNYSPPADWDRGSFILRASWFLFGKPLCASFLPGTGWRKALLLAYGSKIGVKTRIKPRIQITSPWLLSVGDYCWLGEALWIDNLAPVCIGDQVCISQGAYLCTGNHDYKKTSFDLRLGQIVVEDQVWISARAVLAPGTIVRFGAVVSLGAVVSGDIPPGAIYRGNPGCYVAMR